MYNLGHLESFGEFKSATSPILKYSKIYPGLGSTPRENQQDILFCFLLTCNVLMIRGLIYNQRRSGRRDDREISRSAGRPAKSVGSAHSCERPRGVCKPALSINYSPSRRLENPEINNICLGNIQPKFIPLAYSLCLIHVFF